MTIGNNSQANTNIKILRKILLLLALTVLTFGSAPAQDNDPWVGTWTSESYSDTSESPVSSTDYNADYKLVIRITKNNGQYNVRMKTIKVGDTNWTQYAEPMEVKQVEGNAMWVEGNVKKDPFTVDNGTVVYVESYSDRTYYYKLTLNNGTMHHSCYKRKIVEYDRNMRFKSTGEWPFSNRGSELDLFNDDW